jgi:glucokinase
MGACSVVDREGRAALLAADVGGTYARIGLVDASGPQRRILAYRKYSCAAFPGLATILRDFIETVPGTRVGRGVVAAAGHPLGDGRLISANLPWGVSREAIRGELGLDDLGLVNDFEALAHAAVRVPEQDRIAVCGPRGNGGGPVVVIGPGTGLGAAVWLPDVDGGRVLATEAGQMAWAPGNAREMALLGILLETREYVSLEAVLSGPGLLALYHAACALAQVPAQAASPVQVSLAARAGDAQACAALEVFFEVLGSAAGDLVLAYGGRGAVCLAGGILPAVADLLAASRFAARFVGKGAMRAVLEQVPVCLVDHGQLGVMGAIDWYLRQAR